MKPNLFQYILTSLLIMAGWSVSWAQPVTLHLSDTDPVTGRKFFGTVLCSGSECGDASIHAKFGGSGTKSFTMYSPGEMKNIDPVTVDGFFNIRPTSNMVVDKSKVLNFSGSTSNITGSVTISLIQMTISNTNANVSETTAGAELNITYNTTAGTYPVQLAVNKFKVELLDTYGYKLRDLNNSNDMGGQYTFEENFGYSQGLTRNIKATIPSDVSPGTYRVRVVTQGLQQPVIGSQSGTFVITAPAPSFPTTTPTSVSPSSVCPGGQIILNADVIDDGLLGIRENPDEGGKYWVSYYSASTNQRVIDFKTYNEVYTGTVTTRPSGQYTANNKISGPITIPADLPPGNYYCKIFVGEPNNRLNPNNASNSPTFTVKAPPTATISNSPVNVSPGQATSVRIDFTGDGPWWAFSYNDLTKNVDLNTPNNPHYINLYPTSDYVFDASKITNFRNSVCPGTVSGSVQIRVSVLTVKTISVSPSVACPNVDQLKVAFTVDGTPQAGTKFLVQISDRNGNFQALSTSDGQDGNLIGSGTQSPITCSEKRPISTYAAGSSYKVRVISENGSVQSDGSSVGVTLRRPTFPSPVPVEYCENAPVASIKLEGDVIYYNVFKDDRNTVYQSINNKNAPSPPLSPGKYYYTSGRFDDNGCESGQPDFVVTVKATPGAPTVTEVGLCQGGAPVSLTSKVNGESLKWYTAATGGSGQPMAPEPSTSQTGSQSYYVTQTVNACEGPRAQLKVTVYPIPEKPVPNSVGAVCELRPQPVGPFSASGQALIWYSPEQPNGSNEPPRSTTSSPGTYTVAITQTVNGCLSARAIASQVINPAPPKPTVETFLFCKNDPDKPLSATALSGNVLRWYGQNATGGTASVTPPVISAKETKRETYYVTQVDAKQCESLDRQPILVEVADKPAPPTVQANQLACLNTLPVAITAVGNNLLWTGSMISDSTTVAPTPPTSATAVFSYTVVQRRGTCKSAPSTITYRIAPLPLAPTLQSPQLACIGQAPLTLTANGQNLRWYTNDRLTGNSQPQVTVQTNQSGTSTWYVTQTDGNGCQSPSTPLEVRIRAQATARLYGDNQINMFDSTAVRIQFGGDGPWTATLWDDRVITNTQLNPLVVWVRPLETRSYKLKALLNDCGAGAASNTYEIRVLPVTGVDPGKATLSLIASPNPATSTVQVEWSAASRQAISLRMLSATGHVVWQADRMGTGTVQIELIQIGNWAAGHYFLQLQAGSDGGVVNKLMKQ